MKCTCENCKFSFLTWAQPFPEKFPTHHLRCWPDGDQEKEHIAGTPCLKWQFDDGGEAA